MSTPDPVAAGAEADLARFALPVRLVHQVTAVLMTVCILTAAVLYNERLAVLVGHRYVVETLHVVAGLALPVAPVLGLLSRAVRRDVRLLGRLTDLDRRWLRSSSRRDPATEVGAGVGKFNAGQKLNFSLSSGATWVLLGSGLVMYLTQLTPLTWRSGATFVHDWFSLGLGLLVVGHLVHALRDRHAMRGMWSGRVPRSWARREHPAWAREESREPSEA